MGSHVQAKKRAFVKILLRIAALYRFVCKVNRDSSDDEINAAYRKVAHKCHPALWVYALSPVHFANVAPACGDWPCGCTLRRVSTSPT